MQSNVENTGPSQKQIELRLLNCLQNLQAGLPSPFVPVAPAYIEAYQPPGTEDHPDRYLFKTFIQSVHPDSDKRGAIGVGSLRVPTRVFYETVMDEMREQGFTPPPSMLKQAISQSLGVESFEALKVVGGLSQAHDWLDQARQNSSSDRDRAVWGKMGSIVTYVQEAVVGAAQSGLIDDKMSQRILFDASFERKELAHKDWAPPVTAMLSALGEAVMTSDGVPRRPELTGLAQTLSAANDAYENAKSGNMIEMPTNRLGLERRPGLNEVKAYGT